MLNFFFQVSSSLDPLLNTFFKSQRENKPPTTDLAPIVLASIFQELSPFEPSFNVLYRLLDDKNTLTTDLALDLRDVQFAFFWFLFVYRWGEGI